MIIRVIVELLVFALFLSAFFYFVILPVWKRNRQQNAEKVEDALEALENAKTEKDVVEILQQAKKIRQEAEAQSKVQEPIVNQQEVVKPKNSTKKSVKKVSKKK